MKTKKNIYLLLFSLLSCSFLKITAASMSEDKHLQEELINSTMPLAALKKTYVFEESDKSYDLKDSLAAHKESKDSGNVFEEELICHLCDYTTHTQALLNQHKLSKKHAQNILLQEPEKISKDDQITLQGFLTKHICNECDQSFNLKNTLAKHKKSKHSGIASEKECICTLCNYATHTKNALAIHKKSKQHAQNILKQNLDEVSYHDQKFIEGFLTKYTCDQCDKSFNLKKSLANHKKIKYSGILFTCDQCDYTTDAAGNMCRHEERIHYKTRAYKCTECDFSSSEAGYLKKHSEVVHPNKS